LIEVKQARKKATLINVLLDVTPGQRDGLNAVSNSETGVALLAVGCEDTLYIFDWRDIRWLLDNHNPRLPGPKAGQILWREAALSYRWSGPKSWTHDLWLDVGDYQEERDIRPTPLRPAGSSPSTAKSP
jgi:hypothetical protein